MDEQSPESVEPTESVEVESEAVDNDVDLEDIEVSAEEMGESTSEESEDDEEEPTEDESDDEEEDTEEDSEESTDVEEPELSEEDQRKAFNREMAERRIQAKAEREAKLKADQEQYLAEAGDDPLDIAVRQLQMDAYNNKITANANKLTNDYERAIKDFDVLRDATPEVQQEIDAAIDAFQAMHVTVDAYGNPSDVRGDLYQFLQTKADSIKKLTSIGAREQTKSKSKEKSKTFTPPTRAPKQAKVDPDLAAFEEEASKW